MHNILTAREGFPIDTYQRVLAFPAFTMQVDRAWTDARMEDGRIRIDTARGPFHADYAICGTGIRQDLIKNKCSITLTGSDLLNSLKQKTVIDTKQIFQTSLNRRDGRIINLGISYRFGIIKKVKEEKMQFDNNL